jgi:signal transduction histidine kinase
LKRQCCKPPAVLAIALSYNTRIFNTISFRLAALCALLFAACLGLLLTVNYYSTSAALEEQLRARVHDDFNTFLQESDAEGPDAVVREITERVAKPYDAGSYFYVAGPSGAKIVGNLNGLPPKLGWQKLPPGFGKDKSREIWGQGKMLDGGYYIFVGQDASRVVNERASLISSYLWSGLLATFLALVAGLVLSRSFLSRIDAINNTSLAIMQGNLKERIPLRGTSDEIDLLSGNLNKLYDSNQALLESLKQVSSDIAHDLRTPLSRLRNRLEQAKDKKTVKALHGHIEEAIIDSDQLLSTFAALLRIAQIESGTRKSAFAKVDMSDMAEKICSIYHAVAEDEGKVLECVIAPNIFCQGDKELLFQLGVNLVENAIRHTKSGTRIIVVVSAPATLQVSDTGQGIPVDQRQKVLERFHRLDQSRSSPGSGLGLAMVAAIANLHHTQINLEDNAPGLKASVQFQSA